MGKSGCQSGRIWDLSDTPDLGPGVSNLASKLSQIGPKWDKNMGLAEPKCTETDLKKSHICPIRDQSHPI